MLLLLFGSKRLPELGRSLGTGMRDFKNSLAGKELVEPERESPPSAVSEPAAAAPAREHDSI